MAKTITALKIEPGKHPYAVRLYTGGQYLKYAVSVGARYICEVDTIELENGVGILFNAEGALLGLQANRKIGKRIIVGVFYVVGIDETGKLTSLSHNDIDKYWSDLCEPEQYSDDEVQSNYADSFFDFIDNL